jgi:hypothetical protein
MNGANQTMFRLLPHDAPRAGPYIMAGVNDVGRRVEQYAVCIAAASIKSPDDALWLAAKDIG